MSDGLFRQKSGFTAVQNTVAKDKTLSLKAKGLYLVIQAYITIPDSKWKKSSFLAMCQEGEKAFNNAWDELKNKGYLHVHNYTAGGNFRIEYELLDEAAEGPHTFYYNGLGVLTSTNESRTPQNGCNGNGGSGNGITVKRGSGTGTGGNGRNRKGISNNNTFNKIENNIIYNPSTNPSVLKDRWSEIVEYKNNEGVLPFACILQDEDYKAAFIDGIMRRCGRYTDETRQAALETIPVILDEMLNTKRLTVVKGREIEASKILSLIDKRIRVEADEMDLNEVIDTAIANYVRAAKKKADDIKNTTGFLKSCLWTALAEGSLAIQSAIARYEAMVN